MGSLLLNPLIANSSSALLGPTELQSSPMLLLPLEWHKPLPSKGGGHSPWALEGWGPGCGAQWSVGGSAPCPLSLLSKRKRLEAEGGGGAPLKLTRSRSVPGQPTAPFADAAPAPAGADADADVEAEAAGKGGGGAPLSAPAAPCHCPELHQALANSTPGVRPAQWQPLSTGTPAPPLPMLTGLLPHASALSSLLPYARHYPPCLCIAAPSVCATLRQLSLCEQDLVRIILSPSIPEWP